MSPVCSWEVNPNVAMTPVVENWRHPDPDRVEKMIFQESLGSYRSKLPA
jgi:hypothetical protein